MSKVLGFFLLLAVFGIGGYFLQSQKISDTPKETIEPLSITSERIEIKASFNVYTNGTKRVFTDPRYHNLSSDVFIEAGNPNIVNVRKQGVIWNDFFKTLPMSLTKECLVTGTKQTFCSGESGTLKFYINEVEDRDALDKIINEGDRLIVEYGK